MVLNSLPETSKAGGGNAAVAAVAVNELITATLSVSRVLTQLFFVETLFNEKSTNMIADDTKKSYEEQANQTITNAVAGITGGIGELGGAAVGIASENMANRGLEADQAELKTMTEYQKAAQSRVEKEPQNAATTPKEKSSETTQLKTAKEAGLYDPEEESDLFSSEETASNTRSEQEDRMKRLAKQRNYSNEDIEKTRSMDGQNLSDEKIIDLSERDEAQELVDHLDDLISKKEESINGKRMANNRRGDLYSQSIRALFKIFENTGRGFSSYFQEKEGQFRSAAERARPAQQMSGSAMSDLTTQINDSLKTVADSSQITVTVAQGDMGPRG